VNEKKSLTELRADVEKGTQRKKYYENEIRIKEQQIKHLTRAERTHRLCSRGGMLEKFIERPDILSDEQIMKLLTFVFHKDDVQEMLRKMIKDAESKVYEGAIIHRSGVIASFGYLRSASVGAKRMSTGHPAPSPDG